MTKEIYLAAGCFWGAEHYLKCVRGIVKTETGYANGNISHPTYREVYTDRTGYAETVHVVYDPDVLGLDRLIQVYFKAIDPTSLNKQGGDEGTRYRTGIYYTDPAQLPEIEAVYRAQEEKAGSKLAVELMPLQNFFSAEEYHQKYLDKNPGGYCHIPSKMLRLGKEE